MFQLYEKLKNHTTNKVSPSTEELRMAASLPPIDQHQASIIVANIKMASLGITISNDELDPTAVVHLFAYSCGIDIYIQSQVQTWNPNTFKILLGQWLVPSNQPFSEGDNHALWNLLQYMHNCGQRLHIPSEMSIKRRVMKMGPTVWMKPGSPSRFASILCSLSIA
jgi:hypothetical protein